MTCTRKNLTQPEDWWSAFEQQAASEGLSLSEWLGNAGRKQLPTEVRDGLSERPKAVRPWPKEQTK